MLLPLTQYAARIFFLPVPIVEDSVFNHLLVRELNVVPLFSEIP